MIPGSYWREQSRKVIARAIEDAGAKGLEGKDVTRYVSKSYPFSERKGFAYKCWLGEIRKMLGIRKGPSDYRARRKYLAERARLEALPHLEFRTAGELAERQRRMDVLDVMERIRQYEAMVPSTPREVEIHLALGETIKAELEAKGGHLDCDRIRYTMDPQMRIKRSLPI